MPAPPPEIVPDRIVIGDVSLDLLRPRDPEALLSEEAFAHEEFLPYWAELWPSAPALARVLVERELRGVRVLELGCGLGVPSLVAAARGADVTATDWAPDAIDLLRTNAARNGVELATERRDWFADGSPSSAAAAPEGDAGEGSDPADAPPGWPLVVAADVLYEARNVEPVLAALARLTAPGGEVLLADPGRRAAERFWPAAAEAWSVTPVPRAEGERADVRVLRRR